jgi:hypothetical protein
VSPNAVTECREALGFPGEPDRVVLLRRIEATQGVAHVQVGLEVRADFGARTMTVARVNEQFQLDALGETLLRSLRRPPWRRSSLSGRGAGQPDVVPRSSCAGS